MRVNGHGPDMPPRRRTRGRWRLPSLVSGVATGVAAALFVSSGASAAGLGAYPTDPAESEAAVFDSSVLGQALAGAGHSEAGFPTNPGPNQEGLDLELLGGEVIDLGNIQLPVDQFIDFGQLGTLLSESTTTDELNSEAISGLAGGDGALTLDGENADFGAAIFDLLFLFNELGVDGVTDLALDQADLVVGAGGAHVVAENGEIIDQDGVGGPGQYRAGEVSALLSSPAIDEASGMIYDAVGLLDDTMEEQVNQLLDLTGIIAALPGDTELTAEIESNMQDQIFDAILAEPITTNNEVLTVDFSTGTATLHLDQVVSGEMRPGDPTGINNQNPNTELIDDELYPMIAETVHDLMEEVTNIAVGAIEGALGSVTVHFTATLENPITSSSATATWDVNLMGENLTDVTCESTGLEGAVLCGTLETAIAALDPVINQALVPVRDFIVGDAGQQVFDLAIRDIKTGAITVPIRELLEPFIEILAQVVSLQLNHQVTTMCTTADGEERLGGLEVSALSLGLVQAADAARFNLGSAGTRVDACDTAEQGPSFEVTSPVPAGGEAEVTSDGWTPESDVSLQLTGPDGAPAGDPVEVTTDAEGAIPAGTVVPVPEDATAGDYTVVGTGADDTTAEAPVQVYAPTLEVDTPVAPGECAVVTSGGWLPETEITLQLTDASGAPTGEPVVVTTDAEGNLPADTCVTVPEDAAPGDYDVVGTDDNGAEITAPITVDDGTGGGGEEPTFEATSPVPAGGESEVTSEGWEPESEVSLQLNAPDGAPAGDPVTVTTDAEGAFPPATTVPVPQDATAGEHTIVATGGDDTAEAPLEVYAPTLEVATPVQPGECAAVTSGGWQPNTEITLQLTDASGAPTGEPVVVTTDAEGNVPADTCVTIPEDAEPGEYDVIGTDDNGAEITSPVVIGDGDGGGDPGELSLEVTRQVPAGGQLEVVASEGWNPESEVTLDVYGADDMSVLDEPVTVITDSNGTVPEETTITIPADTPAGDYSVLAMDTENNTVTAPVHVYAPTLEAVTPVPPGGDTQLTSTGWLPNADVAFELVDGDDQRVGDEIAVTTDQDGAIPAGTVLTVPAETAPGEYQAVGTDGTATVTAPVQVAADAVAPTLSASSPVPAGGETEVTSDGWDPQSDVTLQLVDSEASPVGEPVEVTTDTEGAIPAGTTVPVPADAAAGEYLLVATGGENTTEATVDVYVPTLEAVTPVPPGGDSQITGGGWVPESGVTLQLTDPEGTPVGPPVEVTTDADGDLPPGTVVPVPEDAAPGEYTVTGTDENGAEITAPIQVEEGALAPVISATSPVPAGSDTEVTSGGWNPSSQVTLQLADAEGAPVGDALEVSTNADGDVPAGTMLTVPEDAAAGDYTVTAVDADGITAEAPVEVYAPTLEIDTPVNPGECAEVTSGGWLPDTEITLDLVDASGEPIGETVTVTTDAEGNVPPGVCVTVPEDTAPGDYEVIGSDENGAEIATPIEIGEGSGDGPSLEASSPVPAGGETSVTSAGWTAESAVTVQLVDADGAPVGDELTVTTDAEGAFPEGTVVPVPADAAAGDYVVTAVDADGITAEAPVEVYAPTLEADSPVAPGEDAEVISGGWLPDTEVTLVLVDEGGNVIGEPIVVLTDENGDVPAGTVVPVPADAAPGNYQIVGSDAQGAEISTGLEVGDAGPGPELPECAVNPTVTVDPAEAQPGDTVTVTGSGFAPGEATVNLAGATSTAALGEGAALGTLTATVGDDCSFELEVTIPEDSEPGDYEFVVIDGNGGEGSAPFTIVPADDGPVSPTATLLHASVKQGGTQSVFGEGFAPGESVEVLDGDRTVGLVTADGNGQVAYAWTVADDATVGQHTVTLSGETSGDATDTYEVVGSGLAVTGTDMGSLIPLAMLLIAAGAAFVVVRRRESVIEEK